MSALIEALAAIPPISSWKIWKNPAWKEYLLTGHKKSLEKLPRFDRDSSLPGDVLEALPGPDEIDEEGKRFLCACHAAGHSQAMGEWIKQCLEKDDPRGRIFDRACAVARECGCTETDLTAHVARQLRPLRLPDGTPTPVGKFLLKASDQDLERAYLVLGQDADHAQEISGLFAAQAPKRWKKLLTVMRTHEESKRLNINTWIAAVAADKTVFLALGMEVFETLPIWPWRFDLGAKLCELAPESVMLPMERHALAQLLRQEDATGYRLWQQARDAAEWLVVNRGLAALKPLAQYFGTELMDVEYRRKTQSEFKIEMLGVAVARLGRGAVPLLEACFNTEQAEVQLQALQHWIPMKNDNEAVFIAAKLRPLLVGKDANAVVRGVRLAAGLGPEAVEPELWCLLSHKSRPVRDAVARTLAKLGDSRLPKAKELWASKRGETRLAAVAWLKAVATDGAAGVLRDRLEIEEDDDVRDAILLALEGLQGTKTMAADPAEIRDRIKKTLAKIEGSPVRWLDPKKLPCPKLVSGSKLAPEWLLYLLYRQSRVKEMRIDLEAKPLFAQLDRSTCGELAQGVLLAFFGSQTSADDRWAMAFAAIVGDDRLVPLFTRQIREWADNMRGKLAEYAVQALALLGTDAALLAVDALSIRYRSKNKNIGKAATEAFADAALARGLTVEELGDRVVPWLGFSPDKPRVVEVGNLQVEVRLGSDFKLSFRDLSNNKRLAKLPDRIPAATKAEYKELAANLKEAVKSQVLRMETLMVRQFRWPVARWKELYLQHPLLAPFAQRLVWGAYDGQGSLRGSFRALEDRSLTGLSDDTYILPQTGSIGVVHPLELTGEVRQGWQKHLADYDIVPPFAQLERPVIKVKPEQRATQFGAEFEETGLNGMTFRGRAERLGWARGSVTDAGGIGYYWKGFPTAGVDVFVALEDMYMGIGIEDEITLGRIFFVKHASVKIGSYEYDEPEDKNDPRLIPFGDVPAIVFSEAMGDLGKIAGKQDAEEPKDDDE